MAFEVLAATTSALESEDFEVRGVNIVPHAHVTAPGIASGETATIRKKDLSGSYHDYYVNGVLQQVTVTHTGVVIDAAGIYQVNKSATAGATSIEVSTPDSP